MRKVIFLTLGLICIFLGIIGVLLPVIPGMIFFVAAAYFFSKSSEFMYLKLLSIPVVGPSIKDWHDYGVMTFQTKFGLIMFLWVSSFSALMVTKNNYAYPLFITNLALVFTFTIIAIDKKIT